MTNPDDIKIPASTTLMPDVEVVALLGASHSQVRGPMLSLPGFGGHDAQGWFVATQENLGRIGLNGSKGNRPRKDRNDCRRDLRCSRRTPADPLPSTLKS